MQGNVRQSQVRVQMTGGAFTRNEEAGKMESYQRTLALLLCIPVVFASSRSGSSTAAADCSVSAPGIVHSIRSGQN